jgi:FkbM family methyltransferase
MKEHLISKWRISALKLYLGFLRLGDRNADILFRAKRDSQLPRSFSMKSRQFRDHVCVNLLRYGWHGYERPLPLIVSLLSQKCSAFVDIGANTGFYSLLASCSGANKVFSYEPVPEIAEMLKENVFHSGLNEKICIRTIALSNESGEANLYIPDSKDARVVEMSASLDIRFRKNATPTPVIIDTLDNQLFHLLSNLRREDSNSEILIKLDVENCEHLVLSGMRETLKVLRPLLIIELLENNTDTKKIKDFLSQLEYEFLCWEDILERNRKLIFSADHRNFVVVPTEFREEVLSVLSQG